MTALTQRLAGLLVVQLGLAAFTWWPTNDAPTPPTPLLPGGGNSLTTLTITGSTDDAEPVSLANTDAGWTITSAFGFPAEASKVAEVVDLLAGVQLGEPAATQRESWKQLEVAPDAFGRKITWSADGTERTAFIGPAASKAVWLRLDGEDAVYRVSGPSVWGFKDTARGYLPPNLVELDKERLTQLTITNAGASLAVSRDEAGAWRLDPAEEGLVVDEDALDGLLDKVVRVRLAEVVAGAETPEHGLGEVVVSWQEDVSGTPLPGGYRLGAEQDGKRFAAKDGSPQVVLATAGTLGDLFTTDLAALKVPAPPTTGDAPEDGVPAGEPAAP
jgi:hypothetical protein